MIWIKKKLNFICGLEVIRTPKGLPEQLAIALTYQCKLVLLEYFSFNKVLSSIRFELTMSMRKIEVLPLY